MSTSEPQLVPGSTYIGTVIKRLKKDLIVQLAQGALRIPLDIQLPPGSRVQITQDPSGLVLLKPLDVGAEGRELQGDSVTGRSLRGEQLSVLLDVSFAGEKKDRAPRPEKRAAERNVASDYVSFNRGRPEDISFLGRIISVLSQTSRERSEPRPAETGQLPNKYLVESRGHRFKVLSWASLEKGQFVHFHLDKSGDNFFLRVLDQNQAVPEKLQTLLGGAGKEYHPAFRLVYDYLLPLSQEPYFPKVVKDFGELVKASGIIARPPGEEPAAEKKNAPAVSSAPTDLPPSSETVEPGSDVSPRIAGESEFPAGERLKPDGGASIPMELSAEGEAIRRPFLEDQLDKLLSVFLKFPRDQAMPREQAVIWSKVIQNPFSALPFLDSFVPVVPERPEMSPDQMRTVPLLLTEGMELSPVRTDLFPPELNLPERFSLAEFYQFLDRQDEMGKLEVNLKMQKFVMQALQSELAVDQESSSGDGQFGYYRHEDVWRGIKFRWKQHKRRQGEEGKPKPVNLNITTETKNMGKVVLDAVLDSAGTRLHFQNRKGDVRELLAQEIRELERQLAHLDFKVESWEYSLLPEEPEQEAFPIIPQGVQGKRKRDDGHLDIRA
ncbi:hypothetical protein ACFL5V_10795 [Fibrobacterota bacterium]